MGGSRALTLERGSCGICAVSDGEPIAVGEDFEYRVTDDTYLAWRCRGCGVVYLDPRPALSSFPVIYPDTYHAFEFDEEEFGVVYTVRQRLEAHRLRSVTKDLPPDARLLDVGCGDGFHLDLLRTFGWPGWTLQGVDADPRAVAAARARELDVREGTVEDVPFEPASFDVVLLIQTVEHVPEPAEVLRRIRDLLKPGGRLLLVTDNTASPDFRLFGKRHWGGYHFPRHLHLYDPPSMRRLAEHTGFRVRRLRTITSPVNWVYSVRNTLADFGVRDGVLEHLSLSAPVALGVGTVFDAAWRAAGRGALLQAELERP